MKANQVTTGWLKRAKKNIDHGGLSDSTRLYNYQIKLLLALARQECLSHGYSKAVNEEIRVLETMETLGAFDE
jgi:hypothetical protein